MSGETKADNRTAEKQEQERDQMLRRLLKMPPQPRPKREREKSNADDKPAKTKGGSRRQSSKG